MRLADMRLRGIILTGVLLVFGLISVPLLHHAQSVGGTQGTGVSGPASSTSGDIPTFNGTNGVTLQDPGACTLTSTVLGCPSGLTIKYSTDTGISRDAAGVVDIGNGTQGDVSGTIKVANYKLSGTIQNNAGTATMGLTIKKGSGAGNYTTASTSYVQVDSTNLLFTVTIPTGWKVLINVAGSSSTLTAVTTASIALTDAGTLLQEVANAPGAAGTLNPFALTYVFAGDGASHSFDLRFKTTSGADSASILNTSTTATAMMTFLLMPSN